MIDMSVGTIISSLEKCASDHNKVFLCQAIQGALRDLLASIFEDDTVHQDDLEVPVAQIVGAGSLLKEVAKVLVNNTAIYAPTEIYVVEMADKVAGQPSKPEKSAV